MVPVKRTRRPCSQEMVGHFVLNDVRDTYKPLSQRGVRLDVYTTPPGRSDEDQQGRGSALFSNPVLLLDYGFEGSRPPHILKNYLDGFDQSLLHATMKLGTCQERQNIQSRAPDAGARRRLGRARNRRYERLA